MCIRSCVALAFALSSAVVVAPSAVAQSSHWGVVLDAATRERLERGELVADPIDQRRGSLRMLGGMSMKVLDSPPAAVWRALEDAPDLGAMLPGDTTVHVTFRQGHVRGALVRHAHGPIEATYHVRMTFDGRERSIFFRLDTDYRSRLRAGWGFVQVSEWPGGRTLVRFGALVDVGSGLVTGLMRPALQRAMLDVPRTIERYMARCTGEQPPAGC